VGRSKDQELALRNRIIVLKLREGKPRSEICDEYGISSSRLSQIITETAPEMPDETMRAFLVLKYEELEQLSQKHASGPGRAMFNGEGQHSKDGATGEYAYDPSPAIQAIEVRNRVLGNISKLYGVDKPPPKPVEESQDLSEMLSWLHGLEMTVKEKDAQIAELQASLAAIEHSVAADVVPTAISPQ
jgi:hypothetical protein